MTAAPELLAAILEKDWLAKVIENAQRGGWLVAHFRPARTAKGWRTAMQGDVGFPDLVLCHLPTRRVLFVELKRLGEKPSTAQSVWLNHLSQCTNIQATWWTPADWDEMEHTLLGVA